MSNLKFFFVTKNDYVNVLQTPMCLLPTDHIDETCKIDLGRTKKR